MYLRKSEKDQDQDPDEIKNASVNYIKEKWNVKKKETKKRTIMTDLNIISRVMEVQTRREEGVTPAGRPVGCPVGWGRKEGGKATRSTGCVK